MECIDHGELRLLPTPRAFTEEEVSVEFDPTKFNRRKRVVIQNSIDDKETDEGQFEDPVNEPFKEGDKALDAQDFSNMDEAMSDDSSSSDEDESDEECRSIKTVSSLA